MEHRDRSSGWTHAKLTGHENEEMVKERLSTDKQFQDSFFDRIGRAGAKMRRDEVGGLHENKVVSVNGNKTKSKTDLKVDLGNDDVINISIKKSLKGQVYLVRAGLFIETIEEQFQTIVPADVRRAIDLFWSGADDAVEIIQKYGDKDNIKSFDRQLKHESLNASTLKEYDTHLHDALLDWFIANSYNITKLSFSMGAASDPREWSDYVWYINLLGENDVDDLFAIDDICRAAEKAAHKETYYGSKNGGTTIQLPFGFVQWHQRQLQFHHDHCKIKGLLDRNRS